jgi:hypothetical protein
MITLQTLEQAAYGGRKTQIQMHLKREIHAYLTIP